MSQSKKNNILVGDIGNTETKIFFRNNKIEKKIALKSNEMIYSKIKSKVLFLKKFNIKDKAVFCSVVPSNFKIIKKVFERELKIKTIELKNIYKNKIIKLKVDKKQIGSDRLANAISVFNKKNNFIVVDFGTATTFDVVIRDVYWGGIIAPGVNLSLKNLISKAELIPKINLNKTNIVIGKNTKQAVASGFYWGYSGLIEKIIFKISKITKKNFKIILTGGLAHLFKTNISFKVLVDKNLTIKGLIKAHKILNK